MNSIPEQFKIKSLIHQNSYLVDVELKFCSLSLDNINSCRQYLPNVYPFTGKKDSDVETIRVHNTISSFSIRTFVSSKDNAYNNAIFKNSLDSKASNFVSTDYIL